MAAKRNCGERFLVKYETQAALVGCWGRVVLVAGLLETEDEEKCCMNDGPVPGLNLEVAIKYRQQMRIRHRRKLKATSKR